MFLCFQLLFIITSSKSKEGGFTFYRQIRSFNSLTDLNNNSRKHLTCGFGENYEN